ncbi:hypothetical protein F7Q99_31285 [Streptomyces kaniharaensis]|uniref:Uncharacterized protein n=1 Tax=Streptomyces kaniharaensis TaxID=212423 RepID=A0A6N7L0A3_9ACTN|nr:hypothetical protein [Streptomyces kaniharaensis]MQS16555.1 hypothetical protein [Streptomyces kaniharaensis]
MEQTAESWSLNGGRRGLAVAACSREEALESGETGGRIQARVTTQAARIADLVASVKAGEPVTVYIWAEDRSWVLDTDYDLWATKVAGPPALIEALLGHPEPEAMRAALGAPTTDLNT